MNVFSQGFVVNMGTALVRVTNDLLMAADEGSLLVLLDLCAAFDTLSHNILLFVRCWHRCIPLAWFTLYLSSLYNKKKNQSQPFSVSCGVPQGSVLDPQLFLSHLIIPSLNFVLSSADDTQLYVSSNPDSIHLPAFLKLNSSKT